MKKRLPGTVFVFTGVAVVGLALLPSSCQAGITFLTGNVPQPGEANILMDDKTTGMVLHGHIAGVHGLLPVEFSSTQDLLMPSGGQARVEAVSGPGGSHIAMTDITVSVPGHDFQDLIFDPHIGGGPGNAVGDFLVSATDSTGTAFSFTYAEHTGENFLTIVATGGQSIVDVHLTSASGFTDLRQNRVSGVSGFTPIPEPASMSIVVMTLASLAAGVEIHRRRRHRALA